MVYQLGVIGGGVMGEALLSRLVAEQVYDPRAVIVSDPMAARGEVLRSRYGVTTTTSNTEASQAEILLLAVKPQILSAVQQSLASVQLAPSTLVLSILAGVTLERLNTVFPQQPTIRVMPNTPATVGAGMTAIAPNAQVSATQITQAERIFAAVGEVVTVPEGLMDAVTGLSGSGPAFVALLIEALADGGVAAGLPRAIAQTLALQTVYGTAQLLRETELHPAQLKDQVTSPGGTTISGVAALEEHGFRSAVIKAVQAAYGRSRELGQSG
ncbi:pyrroline-5-carboxylate reductase [Spirulina major CS-329]|uniref:pyrroline-5-carboxylate reductase n=1 Tax=Spirulina TaxID=1154 RepID=UPI002330D551|nr:MULTISPECIES: pyrroline-5-carboxylate reductase [Spirulina]MDB9493128.1 pyrroline-5-carboxylate reductase [Spirulina subsalsa CS-330]MDB9501896.1 pyrroline-5-carboxylate reductase [Spirulina major CS-329]